MRAVIFDLDGVVVSTDEYHYQAWKRMAGEEAISFDRSINESLRGISRMESLHIILKQSSKRYSDPEKLDLAERKNRYYRELLHKLSPSDILPGVIPLLTALKAHGLAIAIGSSSKNAKTILDKINLLDAFDTIVDGNDLTNSKPDPEVFLLAANRLNVSPASCLVVEDAEAGMEAAVAARMKTFGVGPAARYPNADLSAPDLAYLDTPSIVNQILSLGVESNG
jgi:beta-phosphoglucomutase